MFKNFFEGWYFKHQNKNCTVSVIPGISNSNAFIQIITDQNSYNINFPKSQFTKGEHIKVGNSIFSFNAIKLDINTKDLNVQGEILYNNLTPLKSDIMGPFRFLPMICRHGIISMQHEINGQLKINDSIFEFTNGKGYIEKDSGRSFPKSYVWIQSNDFDEKCCVMVAIADISIFGFQFKGLICTIHHKGNEYRIATYNGGKILKCTKNKIIIYNKSFRLDIDILGQIGFNLNAPVDGNMVKVIKQSPSCRANFKFFQDNNLVFDMHSSKTSFEFVEF